MTRARNQESSVEYLMSSVRCQVSSECHVSGLRRQVSSVSRQGSDSKCQISGVRNQE